MRANFSEAVGQQSGKIAGNALRPSENLRSEITQGHPAGGLEDDAMGEEELEGRVITGQKAIYQPTKEEWDKESVEILGTKFKIRTFVSDLISFFITVLITFIFLQYFALPLIAGSKFKQGAVAA